MRILVIDDHLVVREGLAALFGHDMAQNREVLLASDCGSGLEIAASRPDIDIVLLDWAMPGIDGRSALLEFGRRFPALPVVVLSSSEDPQDVRQAFAAGALGFIPKSASRQTLLSAIQLVLSGNVYVPPLLLDHGPWHGSDQPGAPGDAVGRLTARQREVLRLISQGLSNKEIARALDLSDHTVKVHITAIFKLLGVINRTQAATIARQAGLE